MNVGKKGHWKNEHGKKGPLQKKTDICTTITRYNLIPE